MRHALDSSREGRHLSYGLKLKQKTLRQKAHETAWRLHKQITSVTAFTNKSPTMRRSRMQPGGQRRGKRPLDSLGSSGAFNLAPVISRLTDKGDDRARCIIMAALTSSAAGGRRSSGPPPTLAPTHKECALCGFGVEVKKARGIRGAARDPVDLACEHALHATCLREWLHCVVTPSQRALLDTKTGARYAKSLRQLALAEYGSCFGGRCEACETAEAAKLTCPSATSLDLRGML